MTDALALRRGTQAAVLSASLADYEIVFAADTGECYVYDSSSKKLIGACAYGLATNRPSAVVDGQFYFATDTKILWLVSDSAWAQVTGNLETDSVALSHMAHAETRGLLCYSGDQFTPTVLPAPEDGYVLKGQGTGADLVFAAPDPPSALGPTVIVDGSETGSLSAADCCGTIVSNYGQTTETVTLTLPAADAGLSFTAVVEDAPGEYAWWFKPYSGGYILLDGATLTVDYKAGIEIPAIANWAKFFTYRAGLLGWRWSMTTGSGTWVSAEAE